MWILLGISYEGHDCVGIVPRRVYSRAHECHIFITMPLSESVVIWNIMDSLDCVIKLYERDDLLVY